MKICLRGLGLGWGMSVCTVCTYVTCVCVTVSASTFIRNPGTMFVNRQLPNNSNPNNASHTWWRRRRRFEKKGQERYVDILAFRRMYSASLSVIMFYSCGFLRSDFNT